MIKVSGHGVANPLILEPEMKRGDGKNNKPCPLARIEMFDALGYADINTLFSIAQFFRKSVRFSPQFVVIFPFWFPKKAEFMDGRGRNSRGLIVQAPPIEAFSDHTVLFLYAMILKGGAKEMGALASGCFPRSRSTPGARRMS